MNIYPSLKIEYQSSLTPSEVIDRIKSRIVVIDKRGFSPIADKPYSGFIDENKFLIRKQYSGIQIANPEIKGIVQDQADGCKISLVVTPTLLIKAFMGVWLAFAGLACIYTTFEAILKRDFNWLLLIPYAFFAFGYGVMWAGVIFGTDPDDVLFYDLLGENSRAPYSS
ncbi:MAG TPA: hypothetical protein VK172_08135 [Lentimicrobium sp.]|nr:hypothetical protein [Lentimicrobium sp.]